ncbi:uncharacterized protein LOC113295980 [Papaver somniferum]|uniref:uncharacterized protein LOC113295980 n=1 Tax=Papaver somniferum TaxID=3469 RepID=UPI000E6F8C94|nr:uncharacterized protein LOC113295980 [Papaver somniferum]
MAQNQSFPPNLGDQPKIQYHAQGRFLNNADRSQFYKPKVAANPNPSSGNTRKPVEDGNKDAGDGNRSYARNHVISKIDADSLSHPLARTSVTRKPVEDGNKDAGDGNRSYARNHVISKIDADSISHPLARTSTGEVFITIPRETHARIKAVWEFSLVGRLDFRTLKFEAVKRELLNQWKLGGSVQFIPWVKGYFVIKLDNEDDRKRVSYDGPWKINDQQLKLQPWTSMFDPESDKVTRVAVWVRFKALP